MRVNFAGSIWNDHISMAVFLREIGVDGHLYYDPRGSMQALPEAEDRELVLDPRNGIGLARCKG